MAVTLLRAYGGFASGAIVTFPDSTEQSLIAQGFATASFITSVPSLIGGSRPVCQPERQRFVRPAIRPKHPCDHPGAVHPSQHFFGDSSPHRCRSVVRQYDRRRLLVRDFHSALEHVEGSRCPQRHGGQHGLGSCGSVRQRRETADQFGPGRHHRIGGIHFPEP